MTIIPIHKAWEKIGIDYAEIHAKIASFPKSERGIAAKAEFDRARKLVRTIQRNTHPDRNPGDKSAEDRFKEVSEALHAIEIHTSNFIEQLDKVLAEDRIKRETRRKNTIFIKVD